LREAERGDGEAMSRALVVIRVLLAMVALIVALGALGWILVHVMPVDRSN
jgi:flagellar biogenesis protein FliO